METYLASAQNSPPNRIGAMDNRLIKPIRAPAKPLLLKDHLMDDMSSCSSNGFKSFPRRQCCSTVRFLHDFDRRNKLLLQQKAYVSFTKPPPKPSRSALQTVISAVKRLQFGGAKSPEKRKSGGASSFLPRSFSKKLFRRGSFWRRKPERKEIGPWKSFDQLLKEESQPSDRSNSSITTADENKSYGWFGSDFTASDGGNSSSDLPLAKNDAVGMLAEDDRGVGPTNDDVPAESTTSNSSTETKKQWGSDQEKEQLSPVSILECPFADDDEVSSPFQHRLARMEGTRNKLLKKIQRFECLAQLQPTNLSRRFALLPDSSDDESSGSPRPRSSSSADEEKEENEEEKAQELVDQLKTNMPASYGLKLKDDKLMLDLFKEMIASDDQYSSLDEELVEIGEDWINGRKPFDLFMEWGVEKNRQAYVRDMEKGGGWKTLGEESEEVVLELGNEVFDSLINEMLVDIMS